MLLPNFLIIGAAKSGTTSIYSYLEQHPQVYMSPVKETNFFALEGMPLSFASKSVNKAYLAQSIINIKDYQAQFKDVTCEMAIGEASPMYLYSEQASARIQHYIPQAKLIAILRDPVDRAYSNFLHHIRDDLEDTPNFLEAVEKEKERSANNWWWGFKYIESGFYYTQLKRYLERFDRHQVKVYLYEDLIQNPVSFMSDLFAFIGVDSCFVPNISLKQNVTGVPKNSFLNRFLRDHNPVKTILRPLLPNDFRKKIVFRLNEVNLKKEKLDPAIRKALIPMFQGEVLQLQDLIERDLTHWLK